MFPHIKCDIINSSVPRRTIVLLKAEAKSALRVMWSNCVGGDLRQQTELAHLRALAAKKTQLFVMVRHVRRTTGPTVQTLTSVKLFAQSMHRPEPLHTSWQACCVNLTIIAIDVLYVFHIETRRFQKCPPHNIWHHQLKVAPVYHSITESKSKLSFTSHIKDDIINSSLPRRTIVLLNEETKSALWVIFTQTHSASC